MGFCLKLHLLRQHWLREYRTAKSVGLLNFKHVSNLPLKIKKIHVSFTKCVTPIIYCIIVLR